MLKCDLTFKTKIFLISEDGRHNTQGSRIRNDTLHETRSGTGLPALAGRFQYFFCLLSAVWMLAQGIAFADPETPLGRATIHPSVVQLEPEAEQKFKVVLQATRLAGAAVAENVQWAVNDIPGGNSEIGTIDAEGLYRAPAKTPSPREMHICAEVDGVENRRLWATVLMDSPGPAYELVGGWTEEKANAKYFVDPHCVCLDKAGNLVIADYFGSRVLRFTPDGEYLGVLGLGTGEKPGQVKLPRVVQADAEGQIFVSDQKSDKPRIQVFSHEGEFLRMFAEKGTEPGQMLRAHGLAFDSQERLFVVDVDAMRINVYSHSGDFLYTWGRDGHRVGEFNAPHGIAMDRNDDLFVVGYYGPCQKFTAAGGFLFDFAHGNPPDSAVYFHSVATDRWGNVYLMVRGARGFGGAIEDNLGHNVSVMKYNNNGDYVSSLTLAVKAHKENWATVGPDERIYAIFESNERIGFEIFAPR
ncbi:MAG: NHL repeat-containing protein [bacterium]